MPLYDYVCGACGRRFEVIHGVHADPPTSCPLCGEGPVRKAITAPAVHFKGSGWAKKERRAAVKTSATSSGGTDAGASDGGASKEPGTSGTDAESSPVAPSTSATSEPSKGTATPSKAGTASKPTGRDPD